MEPKDELLDTIESAVILYLRDFMGRAGHPITPEQSGNLFSQLAKHRLLKVAKEI